MIELSISVSAWAGLNWQRWKRLVATIDAAGFAGLFVSDHFGIPGQPDLDSLDSILALAYLADHSQHLHFGPLVSPLSFRDPIMLTRQALALDQLSRGRMILGVGAGYLEHEHTMFGYDLGDIPTRIERFEEGLHVISHLLRSHEPFTYEGRFYRLQNAVLRPRGHQPEGPKLLIGANGPRRTLPLVARYADIWNPDALSPVQFQERSALLDELLHNEGRQPDTVKRMVALPVVCGRNTIEFERRVQPYRQLLPGLAQQTLDAVLASIRTRFPTAIVGSPEEVASTIRAYEEVGVDELVIKWFGVDDIEGLEVLGEYVLPHI
jgi:alkanesulfonate monooxygenase SsuD/methylene tetrahydromethanopterin reductase-like flavin-dependent oxidoreductase (luciferase family)